MVHWRSSPGHPQQAGGPAQRGRLLRLAAFLHRQGRRGRLRLPHRPPHHRLRRHRTRPPRPTRGLSARARRQAHLGDGAAADRLQVRHDTVAILCLVIHHAWPSRLYY
jgi:hypothetical protein